MPSKIPTLQMFRLGLFQLGLGIMSLLTLGLLNRVMINELAIPSTIAAGLIAILYLWHHRGSGLGSCLIPKSCGGITVAATFGSVLLDSPFAPG